jgi:hypothetical protein
LRNGTVSRPIYKVSEFEGGDEMSDRSSEPSKRPEGGLSSASASAGKRRGRPPREGIEPRQLLVLAHLFAGKTQLEAARLVDADPKTVGRWLQEPAVRQEFAVRMAAISTMLWGRVAAEIDAVWEVFHSLLRSDDERIRLRACMFFIDRVLAVLPIEQLIEEGRLAATPMPLEIEKFLGEADGGDEAA